MKIYKCEVCGKEFESGANKYGIPNGVGFELEDGTIFNVCSECISKAGVTDIERRITEKQEG